MKTIEYRHREDERRQWGEGPWDNEPDKVQWQDEKTGLPCLVVRGPMGAWCGYVGVAEDHPLFGKNYNYAHGYDKNYDELPGKWVEDVHGGLTFAGPCAPDDKEHGICHLVEPGENDRVWWFGFDCGHMNDLVPRVAMHEREVPELREIKSRVAEEMRLIGAGEMFRETYKTIDYAKSETRRLAEQLAEVECPDCQCQEFD